MSEYGHQKSLQEILQELVTHCNLNGDDNARIIIGLPEKTLRSFSNSVRLMSATQIYNSGNIERINLAGGTVVFI